MFPVRELTLISVELPYSKCPVIHQNQDIVKPKKTSPLPEGEGYVQA
jgi:hypothetical protein